MTISGFARERRPAGWQHYGMSVGRAYRDRRRAEAEARQAAFDADVARVGREQNVDVLTARDVVRARRRFEHRRAERTAS